MEQLGSGPSLPLVPAMMVTLASHLYALNITVSGVTKFATQLIHT